jgi:hypothetical protein
MGTCLIVGNPALYPTVEDDLDLPPPSPSAASPALTRDGPDFRRHGVAGRSGVSASLTATMPATMPAAGRWVRLERRSA